MDMKQLKTFITLSHTLNYQKAAAQLQYAPSTLFKHIQLLEQELGVALFAKDGRQLRLTAEGEAFCEHAQRLVEQYQEAVLSVSGAAAREPGLTIGGCEINTANSLLELFAQFNREYPEARVSMMTTPNVSVAALAKSDMIDIGYVYTIRQMKSVGIQSLPLYQEPVWLMASQEHPLARRKALHYTDLEGVDFVYPHDSCCFVTEFLSRLERRGVSLGKCMYVGNMDLVIELARQGNAMTLVPYNAVKRFERRFGMTAIDMDEEPIWAWQNVVFKSYDALAPIAKSLLRQSLSFARGMTERGEGGVRSGFGAALWG